MQDEPKTTFLVPNQGRGKELCELLRKELGVPESAIIFSVQFAVGDVIKVSCEYIPRVKAD